MPDIKNEIKGFEDAKRFLLTLPNQCSGRAMITCETGEQYKEFRLTALARPSDVGTISGVLSNDFVRIVLAYFDERDGTIYWRVKPCFSIEPHQVWQFDCENGPDKDFIRDKLGYADKEWVAVKAYCRVCRSDKPAIYDEVAA